MNVSFNGTPVLVLRHASFLLLAEQGAQGILLSEGAHMSTGLLEEDLQLATGNLSHAVNLLHQLLKQRSNVPFVEASLVCADGGENLWL